MTEIIVIDRLADLYQVALPWNRLREGQPLFFPSLESLYFFLNRENQEFRVFAAKRNGEIVSLCCFVYERVAKPFRVSERKLFSLTVRQVRLFGSAVLGYLDAEIFRQYMNLIGASFPFDLVSFGEIPVESPLHRSVRQAGVKYLMTSPYRRESLRWLIRFPETFEEYLKSLSANQRQAVKRKMRKLEQEAGFKLSVVTHAEQVDDFLRDGEAISRLTYQWNVGDRLCNDMETRGLYFQRAQQGQLRCYIVYLRGRPCAFLRGEVADRMYYYETPGYDPNFASLSPGTCLLMWAIQDLIERTGCEAFDFGPGGDAIGYKAKFGNVALKCVDLELARWSNPYSIAIVLIQEMLRVGKNIASWLIGYGEFRQYLRRAIRKYGVT